MLHAWNLSNYPFIHYILQITSKKIYCKINKRGRVQNGNVRAVFGTAHPMHTPFQLCAAFLAELPSLLWSRAFSITSPDIVVKSYVLVFQLCCVVTPIVSCVYHTLLSWHIFRIIRLKFIFNDRFSLAVFLAQTVSFLDLMWVEKSSC